MRGFLGGATRGGLWGRRHWQQAASGTRNVTRELSERFAGGGSAAMLIPNGETTGMELAGGCGVPGAGERVLPAESAGAAGGARGVGDCGDRGVGGSAASRGESAGGASRDAANIAI